MKILLVAAEESGSIHALELVKNLKSLGDYRFVGTGSSFLKEEIELLYTSEDLSFVGLEDPRKIFKILKIFLKLKKTLQHCDGALLVDYPGMNLRLASFGASMGKKICYYVAPQVWAWRESRVKTIRNNVHALCCLFSFEEEFFKKRGVNARFFGHPLADKLLPLQSRRREPYVLLLPGSRDSEVKRLLPIMLEAAKRIKEDFKLDVMLAKAPSVSERCYTIPSWVEVVEFPKRYEAMSKATLAISASGTATLELALLKTPTIVVYKVSPLTWHIGKRLVKVNFLSIVNILAGREVFPELLQERCLPENIYKKARAFLECEEIRANTERILDDIAKRLKGKEPYKKAAEFFHEVLRKSN